MTTDSAQIAAVENVKRNEKWRDDLEAWTEFYQLLIQNNSTSNLTVYNCEKVLDLLRIGMRVYDNMADVIDFNKSQTKTSDDVNNVTLSNSM